MTTMAIKQRMVPTGWRIVCGFLPAFFALLRLLNLKDDSVFTGDSAYRLFYASKVLLGVQGRLWLPALQAQICGLHILDAALWGYRLIPIFYFWLSLVFLARLSRRLCGESPASFLFTVLILLSFAHNSGYYFIGTQLYQEMMCTALFLALLDLQVLELPRNKLVFAVAAIGLLTREVFWVYLLAATVLNVKKIRQDKLLGASFFLLWGLIALWLFSSAWWSTSTHLRWPLTAVTSHASSAYAASLGRIDSFARALEGSGARQMLGGLLAAFLLITVFRKQSPEPPDKQLALFRETFRSFSIFSLGFVVGTTLLFDPFRPAGNIRMSFPILDHLFVWSILAFSHVQPLRGIRGLLASSCLFAGLVLSIKSPLKSADSPLFQDWLRMNALLDTEIKKLPRVGHGTLAVISDQKWWDVIPGVSSSTLQVRKNYFGSYAAFQRSQASERDFQNILCPCDRAAAFTTMAKVNEIPYLGEQWCLLSRQE